MEKQTIPLAAADFKMKKDKGGRHELLGHDV